MRLKALVRMGAVVLVAMGLAACDGSENARTLPTADPEYVSPAMIGPEVPEDHQAGEAGEGTTNTEGSTVEHPGEGDTHTEATAEAE